MMNVATVECDVSTCIRDSTTGSLADKVCSNLVDQNCGENWIWKPECDKDKSIFSIPCVNLHPLLLAASICSE